jgi:hypothetical protein
MLRRLGRFGLSEDESNFIRDGKGCFVIRKGWGHELEVWFGWLHGGFPGEGSSACRDCISLHNVDIKELMFSRVPKGEGIRDNRDEKQETHFMTQVILCLGGRDRNKT